MATKWPDFGKKLDQTRRRARLTQQEMADQVGEALRITVNQQTVSYWCRGETIPRNRDTFLAICQVLHAAGALSTVAAANHLLKTAEQGALHDEEIRVWLPDLSGKGEAAAATQGQELADKGEETMTETSAEAWAQRLIERVGQAMRPFEQPETQQAAGVIILATLLLAGAWRAPDQWRHRWSEAALLIAAQWISDLLLIWPPSRAERVQSGRERRWRRLYRLSGAAAGVMTAVGVLFFASAFVQVIFGRVQLRWLSFLVLGAGAVFAYAGGLKVQAGASQVQEQAFYRRASAQITILIFIAQALLPVFFVIASPQLTTGYLAVITVAVTLLWSLLRRR